MQIFDSEEMRNIDNIAINDLGIPSLVLMENAGRSVFSFLKENFSNLKNKKIIIIAGSGNNGGDALAAARYLYNYEADFFVFLLGEKEKLSKDNLYNLKILEYLKIKYLFLNKSNLEEFKVCLRESHILIDGIFGTGLKRKVNDFLANLIELINQAKLIRVSIDIPSGVDASSGEILGAAVNADYTITLAYPKLGLFLYPAYRYSGKIISADIGIPYNLTQNITSKNFLITFSLVKNNLPKRDLEAHKGLAGKILVIAGSIGYTGAAALTCNAALRIGAGMVTLALPESLNLAMESKLTEVITLPLPEKDGVIAFKAYELLKDKIKEFDLLVIGPGLGQDFETQKLVLKILEEFEIPVILDADALNILAKNFPKKHPLDWILTPHPLEFSRLIKKDLNEILNNPISLLKMSALDFKAVIVLKKANSIIASKEGEIYINLSGNPGLAKAGSGDVLTGMIAGLKVQGLTSSLSAILGTYLHGYTADRLIEKYDYLSLMPKDLIDYLPFILKKIREGE
ncbi:MAG: NAD(P)H-hydrate dehydratase [Armatimonadetes bacterium]|nr:NAD(P)H-hydrate dehydratase [Armatimonadota bacterium]